MIYSTTKACMSFGSVCPVLALKRNLNDDVADLFLDLTSSWNSAY
jgi:hypothetical protein